MNSKYLKLAAIGTMFLVMFQVVVFFVGQQVGLLTLDKEFAQAGGLGEEVKSSLRQYPSQVLSTQAGAYQISERTIAGPTIVTASSSPEEKKKAEETREIKFPKNYMQPLELKLDDRRTIRITDKNNLYYETKLLYEGEAGKKGKVEMGSAKEDLRPSFDRKATSATEIAQETDQPKYVRYRSDDGRKTIYYTYQKRPDTGLRQIKNWVYYERGNGKEAETYSVDNAQLRLNKSGEIEGYYRGEQEISNEEIKGQVGDSLFERARLTLEKETGQDIENGSRTPDFIIPRPYFLDKDGNRANLDWQLSDDKQSITVELTANADQYPLALDPTLQFTAPGQASEGSAIDGEGDGDKFGASMISGDFNSDGKIDLAVTAAHYPNYVETGRVYIFFNNNSFVTTASSADVIISAENAYDLFGSALSAGDFNNDGRTDLAVGAEYYPAWDENGRVYIFYNDGSFPAIASDADLIVAGEATDGDFGSALAAGDFNADGKTDLAVGAYGYSTNTGRAYVFYNDGSMPTTAATADKIITGGATSNFFGDALAAGDFNADGKTDLAVGAYGYSTNTGRAYIFYNDGSMPTTAATADITITGVATNNRFGWSLAAGDFNDDGKMDLAAGALAYNSGAGGVFIFHNDGSMPTTASTSDVIIVGEASSNLGSSLAANDLDGDGKDDLAVGAENAVDAMDSGSYPGRVYVFNTWNGVVDLDNNINGTADNVSGDGIFGSALAAGDFNADGKTDLAVGAQGYNSGTGRTYVFYNDSTMPTAAASADAVITGQATGNWFGYALVAGDFNADGKTDLAVGGHGYSTYTGRAYIFYNDGSFPSAASAADVTITGGGTNNDFGRYLSAGDFNADGRVDLAVCAYRYNVYTGRVYLFYNDGTLPTAAGSADLTITGQVTSSYFGSAMTAGDFNNDSRIDLAIGGSGYGSGRTYVFYNDGSMPTAAASADIVIVGEAGGFGTSLTSGDFNTDGKTDLVVGAEGYGAYAGRAYVFYNDGSIPATATSADLTIDGAAINGRFSTAMTAADLNNDGRTDLVVGAYNYDSGTGRTYVFYNDGSIPTTASTADAVIAGETASDLFGFALIGGDFNADGLHDLAVGASGYGVATGRVYFIYGGGPIPASAGLADAAIGGEVINATFGAALFAGDFNADGRTDLATSAFGYNSSAGRVYLFYNDGSVPATASTADVIIDGEAIGDSFGRSLAAGDFNADGRTDLIVGASIYGDYDGRVYVFYNDGSFPSVASGADIAIAGETIDGAFGGTLATGDFNDDGKDDLAVGAYLYPDWDETGRVYLFYNDGSIPATASTADNIIDGEMSGDRFGDALATGDFNDDGKDDLAAGAHGYPNWDSQGRVYLFYGDGSIPVTASTADNIIDGEMSGDNFGHSLIAGDFNADSRDDLATGAYGYGSNNNGRAYIFYNDGSIPTTAAAADAAIAGATTSDRFGYALAADDFNADGRIDLVVSAYGYNAYLGRVHLFYNDGSIPTTASAADVTITGDVPTSYFGVELKSGDFNADGYVDMVIRSSGNQNVYFITMKHVPLPALPDAVLKGKIETKGSVIIY